MDFQALIQQYGYVAVAVGALLEGETVLLLAAFSAHLGLLDLRWVLAVAALFAFIGDSLFFLVGRLYGRRLMQRFPALGRAVPRVDRFVGRWHWLAVVVLRFTYGLRIAGPIILGAGRMRAMVFVLANALGAVLWAALIGGLGYVFGAAVARVLGDLHKAEVTLVSLGVGLAVVVAVVHHVLKRRSERSEKPGGGG